MKRLLLWIGLVGCAGSGAFAADTERGLSVYDAIPECKERNSGLGPACVLKEEGVPRTSFPPTAVPVVPNAPGAPPPAAPIPRESAPAAPRRGG